MVCYGNVSSMQHIHGTSFDNTGQHIFLKTDARNQGHSGRLAVCTASVTPKMCSQTKIWDSYVK